MLLTINIGNTNTVLGFFQGKKLKYRLRMVTDPQKTVDQWGRQITVFARSKSMEIKSVGQTVIGSVVPRLTATLQKAAARYIHCPVTMVNADLKLGIAYKYRNPRELGADRIANAMAAINKYPLPCIVVDMGTATTFSIILKKGIFAGGLILPGVGTALAGLTQKTALLPDIDVQFPPRVIGKTTRECMQAGITYGTIDQINGIIARIEKELKVRATIVLTGGWANPFAAAFKKTAVFDPDLTLEGLRIIGETAGRRGK